MKKRTILAAFALLMPFAGMMADNGQTVTVSGQTLLEKVTSLTFDGDNVNLLMADGTTMTADMDEVKMTFEWNPTTGIDTHRPPTALDERTATYDLQGRRVEGRASGGLFLVRQNGKTVKLIKK